MNIPKLIVKYYRGEKKFSPVYLMGNHPEECEHAGILTTHSIEKFIEANTLKEILVSDIILKYSKHAGFSPDIRNVTYYELINQTKNHEKDKKQRIH